MIATSWRCASEHGPFTVRVNQANNRVEVTYCKLDTVYTSFSHDCLEDLIEALYEAKRAMEDGTSTY
jgi:hypothetical protein